MYNLNEIRQIVGLCDFPGLDGHRWNIMVGVDGDRSYLQIDCEGACNVTGKDLSWKSRKWFLSPYMCKSEIVRTVHKMILNAVAHEVNEKFTYRGKRIYDPHIDVDALAAISEDIDVRKPEDIPTLNINGESYSVPGKTATYEYLVLLAGYTGNPSMTWFRKSNGSTVHGSLSAGGVLALWGNTHITCVHTGNA